MAYSKYSITRLSDVEKEAYDTILDGMEECSHEILIKSKNIDELDFKKFFTFD